MAMQRKMKCVLPTWTALQGESLDCTEAVSTFPFAPTPCVSAYRKISFQRRNVDKLQNRIKRNFNVKAAGDLYRKRVKGYRIPHRLYRKMAFRCF